MSIEKKRYIMNWGFPVEEPDGEWVRYEDVKHIITVWEACNKVTTEFKKAMDIDVDGKEHR